MTGTIEQTHSTSAGFRANRCVAATTSTGAQCKNSALRGGTVCKFHGGSSPNVKRKALVRATLSDWGISDDLVDPGETLLRLVAQSARRVSFYGELLRQSYAKAEASGEDTPSGLPKGVSALIGKRYSSTGDGVVFSTGEAIRGLAELEIHERKLCADFTSKAIAAGLAERQVRLAERQGAAIIGAILVALDRAGIVGPARLEAQNAAADYLLELGA